jgi:hypothetical protein
MDRLRENFLNRRQRDSSLWSPDPHTSAIGMNSTSGIIGHLVSSLSLRPPRNGMAEEIIMRNVLMALAAFFSVAPTVSLAQQCSLADFDKGGLRQASETLRPQTNDSKFEWGSDVDPWNGEARVMTRTKRCDKV